MLELYKVLLKEDGSEYEPLRLAAMMYSIKRFLIDAKYSHQGQIIDIMGPTSFEDARKTLKSKRVELKRQGLGNQPNLSVAVDPDEERVM